MSEGQSIAGLTMVVVDPNTIAANPWNPNRMTDATFEKVKRSIVEHGFVDPVTVREIESGYEIVDGENRWRAAKALGIAAIPVANLGPISDHKAKKLTIIYNELRGAPEPDLLAQVLADLANEQTLDSLVLDLPMTMLEIDTLIKSTEAYDWALPDLPPERSASSTPTNAAHELRVFALGTVREQITLTLTNHLVTEFNNSAAGLGTQNAEMVLRDWVRRLALAPALPAPEAALEVRRPRLPKAKKTK